MMAKSMNALFTGRIQKRKTNPLHHSHLACNTRPVHTVGSFATGAYQHQVLPCPLNATRKRPTAVSSATCRYWASKAEELRRSKTAPAHLAARQFRAKVGYCSCD